MTTITTTASDRCGRCAVRMQANDLFCGSCGAARADEPLTLPIPLPRHAGAPRARVGPPPEVTELRRPVVVLVAQVMLGLTIVADFVWALVGGAVLLSFGPLVAGIDDPEYAGDARAALLAGVLAVIACAVAVVVNFRAQRGVGHRKRSARKVVTVFPAVEALVTLLVLMPLGGDTVAGGVVSLVIGLPWAAVTALLLWLPEDSRRWFGDPSR